MEDIESRNKSLTFAGVRFSSSRNELVDLDGNALSLRPRSLSVFRLLASRPGRVFERTEILDSVWPDVTVTEDSINQCVADIRKLLSDDGHTTLKTVQGRGYALIADDRNIVHIQKPVAKSPAIFKNLETLSRYLPIVAMVVGILLLSHFVPQRLSVPASSPDTQFPGIYIHITSAPDVSEEHARILNSHLRRILLHYRNINLVTDSSLKAQANAASLDSMSLSLSGVGGANGYLPQSPEQYNALPLARDGSTDNMESQNNSEFDFLLKIHLMSNQNGPDITAELQSSSTGELLWANSYKLATHSETAQQAMDEDIITEQIALRISAAIASPGIGQIDRYLLKTSRLKPVEQLSAAECQANGFGCAKCSGIEDNIFKRTEECLEIQLENNPDDARSWALQATVFAHRYWYGNTLPEPYRSNLQLRRHFPSLAVEAASKAEQLSDRKDSTIYWGMAEAYFSSCNTDKLRVAVERGLEANPFDPNLRAAFGNWLSYSGAWQEGEEMTLEAINMEPRQYRRWWWMGPAKSQYAKGQYEQAMEYFLKAFDHRNWVSHLQIAYTLPWLGRIEEARQAVKDLHSLKPGYTIEQALEYYESLCFPDDFLRRMKLALTQAGLDSRGNSTRFDNIVMPRPQTVQVNGIDMEYLTLGSGETILFVHGAFSDYRAWYDFMLPVSENHKYFSYSRRYFGTQPWADDGHLLGNHTDAEDLISLIETLNLGAVHLVGWSSGSGPISLVALDRPDLVKSVTHFEPVEKSILDENINQVAFMEYWDSGWAEIDSILDAGDNEKAAEVMLNLVFDKSSDWFQKSERESFKEMNRQNARTVPLDRQYWPGDRPLTCELLSGNKIPTLILVGSNTNDFFRYSADRFYQCDPQAQLAYIADTNHRAPIEKTDQIIELLLAFVDEHS